MVNPNATRAPADGAIAQSAAANAQLPKAPSVREVKHERLICFDLYKGTKEALVAADIVADGRFPGDPGRGKASCSYDGDGTPCRAGCRERAAITIRRYGKTFRVWVSIDEEEEKRRREASALATEWRKKAVEADAEAKREADKLAELPSTGEEFACRAADLFWASFHIFFNAHCRPEPGDSGYRFNAADSADFLNIAQRLYSEIEGAEPRFDGARRMRKVTEARAKAAKVDMPLQRLLSSAMASPRAAAG